jgi:membrane protease YdiL (CAAX protease family)
MTAPAKARLGSRQARPRPVVALAPLALIAVTYPVFRIADASLTNAVGGRLAWFVGMGVYWAVWGWGFSVWVLGRRRTWDLIRPRSATTQTLGHVGFVVAMAALVRFLVPRMEYTKATTGAAVLLAISPFANGVFEELLWRGVFLTIFPESVWLRVVWPSVMFGLWHLVPGSISPGGPHVALVIGPTLMGFYLAWLSKRTGTVWWAILAHALGGLVMIS